MVMFLSRRYITTWVSGVTTCMFSFLRVLIDAEEGFYWNIKQYVVTHVGLLVKGRAIL